MGISVDNHGLAFITTDYADGRRKLTYLYIISN
jgi:hypothetical protein